MMEKKLIKKLFDFIKQNLFLTIASVIFIISLGINTILIYNFVQVLQEL